MEMTPLNQLSTCAPPSLALWMAEWCKNEVERRLRPSTQRHYNTAIREVCVVLGDLRLDQLTTSDIAGMIDTWLLDCRPPSTIRRNVETLRTALSRAVRRGLIDRNVAREVALPIMQRHPPRWLDVHEIRVLLDHCAGQTLEAAYALAALVGLRRGEILGLVWSDLDFGRRIVRIERARTDAPGKNWACTLLKSRAAYRTLVLPTQAYNALQRLHVHEQTKAQAAGTTLGIGDHVFTSRTRAPLTPSYLNWDLSRRLRLLRLPHIRFHDLRHTAACLMLQRKISPRTVADILGHRHVTTTLEIYAHVHLDDKIAAAREIENALAGEDSDVHAI